MVNNHDTRRFMSLEGATLEGAMLHTAFMLTVRGTPQLYSGEEIAMDGKDDPDNRRDFPGGFPDDKHNAFLANQRTPNQQRMWQWTHDWIKLRREHSAIRQGRLVDLFYDDDTYAYARRDANETVIIVINRSAKEKKITIPARSVELRDGAELIFVSGSAKSATVKSGQISLIVPGRMAVAYRTR
jgi:glycosidase